MTNVPGVPSPSRLELFERMSGNVLRTSRLTSGSRVSRYLIPSVPEMSLGYDIGYTLP